jgi:hypothetical protein
MRDRSPTSQGTPVREIFDLHSCPSLWKGHMFLEIVSTSPHNTYDQKCQITGQVQSIRYFFRCPHSITLDASSSSTQKKQRREHSGTHLYCFAAMQRRRSPPCLLLVRVINVEFAQARRSLNLLDLERLDPFRSRFRTGVLSPVIIRLDASVLQRERGDPWTRNQAAKGPT